MALRALLRAFVLVVTLSAGWSLECFSETNEDVQACYMDNKLATPYMPSYISATLTEAQNLRKNCGNQPALLKATKCAFYAVRQCVSSNPGTKAFAKFVPLPSRAEQSVRVACSNLTYWNEECFEEENPKYIDCLTDYVQSLDVSIPFEDRICAAFNQSDECLKTSLNKCGCATVKLLLDIKKTHHEDPCGPTPHVSVQCDPQNPSRFKGGSASLRHFSAGMLISLAIMTKLCELRINF